jgi:hypothetical protein
VPGGRVVGEMRPSMRDVAEKQDRVSNVMQQPCGYLHNMTRKRWRACLENRRWLAWRLSAPEISAWRRGLYCARAAGVRKLARLI